MSLDEWIEKAKKDGIVKEEKKMEVENEGSNPSRGEYRKFKDKEGLWWIVTPRRLKFPFSVPYGHFKNVGVFKHERFADLFPEVKSWQNNLVSERIRKNYTNYFLDFCIDQDITPREFGDLWETIEGQTKASRMVTKYIQGFMREKPNRARKMMCAMKSFFRSYSAGFKLSLDTSKGGALYISPQLKEKHERPRYSYGTPDEIREKMAHMIPTMSRDLKDEMALTILFRAGVRGNVLEKLRVKDIQDRFEVENPLTKELEQVLCFTITSDLDYKIASYEFPRLLDAPGQPRGYYTYLARDSLEMFDRFMDKYYRNSPLDKLLFAKHEGDRFRDTLTKRVKYRLESAGYPKEKIRLHHFRANFDELAHEALKKNRAEMLAGHKLDGVQEHYLKRNKIACAQDYLKINFKPSIETMKEKWLEELKAKKEAEEQKVAKAIEPKPVQPKPIEAERTQLEGIRKEVHKRMESIIETMIGPAPKKCLRNLDFKHAKDDRFCHTACAKTRPDQYKACQEAKKENPELFT